MAPPCRISSIACKPAVSARPPPRSCRRAPCSPVCASAPSWKPAARKLAYTITSVKEQPIPASVFEVPKGYRETPFEVSGEEPAREP